MFLLIDKPKGMTSHDVVDFVRNVTRERRVGHAGTLDPNATGLLVVGVGRETTKKLGEITKLNRKSYLGEICLGETRDSDDAEGILTSKAKGLLPPEKEEVRQTLMSFLGEQMQVPPQFSAIKLKGKKAYEMARRGKEVDLKARPVTIYSIQLKRYLFPLVSFEVQVSSGTYIRSLARDIGKKLGCGAYLANLQRTRIGEYKLEDALSLEAFAESFKQEARRQG